MRIHLTRLSPPLFVLLGVVIGAVLSAVIGSDAIGAGIWAAFPQIVITALSIMLLVIVACWAAYFLLRRWSRGLLRTDTEMTEVQIIDGLVDHFTTPDGVANPTPDDRRRAALVNLGLWLARREAVQFSFNATVTVVGGLVGAATLFLLYEQNRKLDLQNERLVLQTDANIAESILLEGTRRASLADEVDSLIDAIAVEVNATSDQCDDQITNRPCWDLGSKDRRLVRLSRRLDARIVAFSRRSGPYRIAIPLVAELDFDAPLREQYNFQNTSPERGRVLQALLEQKVFVDGNFDAAYMAGVTLRDTEVASASLSTVDFDGASFVNSVFFSSNLSGAYFTNTHMTEVNFSLSNLGKASFDGAFLRNVNFSGAYVGGASFKGANVISDKTFTHAWMWDDDPDIVEWPEGWPLISCAFDKTKHERSRKPFDCRP